jgi:NAD(P)-dependent dehydrogenase (short-subunit alcohol dehydrogenase family)
MKTIFLTGATDGIGFVAAQKLGAQGHRLLIHGRDPKKLEQASRKIAGAPETYLADLSNLDEVALMCQEIKKNVKRLDSVINNAGVLKTSQTRTASNRDIRFEVNTVAPYLIARELLPIIDSDGIVINLSSAAQRPVDIKALRGFKEVSDMEAYAQSKLAITAWSYAMGREFEDGPCIAAVNPGSLLATKMVKEGFGIEGNDVNVGADILVRFVNEPEYSKRTGEYFDNDSGRFAPIHEAATNDRFIGELIKELDRIIAEASLNSR